MTLTPAHGRLGRGHRTADAAADRDQRSHQTQGAANASLRLARPSQWPKNLLVAAAPAAAGVLDQRAVLAHTTMLLVAFIAASSAVYCLNDTRDRDADRAHPVKRHRPVASGTVTPRRAITTATVAAVAAVAIALSVSLASAGVVVGYLALSTAYSLRLKHVAVLDIIIVATGFVLRALSGAVGNQLPVSSWFMLVSLFGALYLVTGKRAAEALRPAAGDSSRAVLAQYPQAWLQQVVGVALTGALLSYAMWAFQDLGTDVFPPVVALSVAPFLVVLLRYGLLLAQGGGERPERLVWADLPLLIAGATWAALLTIGLYAA